MPCMRPQDVSIPTVISMYAHRQGGKQGQPMITITVRVMFRVMLRVMFRVRAIINNLR